MGILRSIESRLERVVEGSVGRLFRASVAPVELARKLAKELEEGKVVSVTQTYAPNEYTIYLSPRDRTRFADFEASLRNELASYLAEHARRAGYVMPTRPKVRFETESSLHTGIFGISTALVRDDEAPLDPVPAAPACRRPAGRGCPGRRRRALRRVPVVPVEPCSAGVRRGPGGLGRALRRATGAGALAARPRPVGPAPRPGRVPARSGAGSRGRSPAVRTAAARRAAIAAPRTSRLSRRSPRRAWRRPCRSTRDPTRRWSRDPSRTRSSCSCTTISAP